MHSRATDGDARSEHCTLHKYYHNMLTIIMITYGCLVKFSFIEITHTYIYIHIAAQHKIATIYTGLYRKL